MDFVDRIIKYIFYMNYFSVQDKEIHIYIPTRILTVLPKRRQINGLTT